MKLWMLDRKHLDVEKQQVAWMYVYLGKVSIPSIYQVVTCLCVISMFLEFQVCVTRVDHQLKCCSELLMGNSGGLRVRAWPPGRRRISPWGDVRWRRLWVGPLDEKVIKKKTEITWLIYLMILFSKESIWERATLVRDLRWLQLKTWRKCWSQLTYQSHRV